MNKISRQQAKQQKLMYYFTGRPCKYGHVAKRRVTNSTCYECELSTSKAKRDPIRKIKYDALYHKVFWSRQYQRHQSKYLIRSKTHRARRKQALPSWYEKEHQQIYDLYIKAQQLTEETGVPHHVDHIIPITNDKVCGLHTFNNLQILSAHDNLIKGNKF